MNYEGKNLRESSKAGIDCTLSCIVGLHGSFEILINPYSGSKIPDERKSIPLRTCWFKYILKIRMNVRFEW